VTHKKLRILMVMHMPWSRELGAPRVSLETADEFIKLGHTVEKFDIVDAFPAPSKLETYFLQARFPSKAINFVRENAHRFDVIQAEHGNLPRSKADLKFRGLLVARCNGLAHFYDAYGKQANAKDKTLGIKRGTAVGNLLRYIATKSSGGLGDVEKSFNYADLIVLNNKEEYDFVSQKLGHAGKVHSFPNGFSEIRFAQFEAERVTPAERWKQQLVVFIGGWGQRKGSDDFPAIVSSIRERLPDVRFLFLGTGIRSDALKSSFASKDRDSISVISSYKSDELPHLLRNATTAILPTYIEGFPSGVLESCVAGIPTVSYDVPGPREMLKLFDRKLLTPAGDTKAIADATVSLLSLGVESYCSLSEQTASVASRFRWKDIADNMLDLYYEKLSELKALSS